MDETIEAYETEKKSAKKRTDILTGFPKEASQNFRLMMSSQKSNLSQKHLY